ncbi:hypothetical protein IMG5_153430 [Ichthyophthirius multifiliis]|uniref:Uncharacterized protein n=1 Tax=Ichthyophthirius multifiliis TaxID=5932 RepID=G0QZ00_ICHMU|nr:hypothetical protein IMG5_153430 [Ichthyophthirius multifiliis]EGR29571.1 hypothetical protein IMG5_153430 [Ichthyophthirius multifiliis]|eukprot:XP_004030807.1 hypothetical protein IMG5_153430 [Ichthyophthirius multifiliis]
MMEYIKQKSLQVANQSQNKVKNNFKIQKMNQRPVSSLTQINKRTIYQSQKQFKISEQLLNMDIQHEKPPAPNKSKYYLLKQKEREKEIDRLLKLTISKGRNEFEYEMLIKMGEANELSQQLNSKITYRAYRSAQGNLKVHIYELDKYQKDMTLEDFQREFNTLKNKYNETKNLRIWEVLSQNKKSKQKDFTKQTKDEEKETDKRHLGKININARHEELKGVLLKTMELTVILKEQLAVLNKQKINVCQQGNNANKIFINTVNHSYQN